MNDWDDIAAVRTRPRRTLGPVSNGGLYFSPDLAPALDHPAVARLGEGARRTILVQQLYGYMDFTANLEHRYVNEVALQLAHGEAGIHLPPDMRFDAYRLYCDEAYHAVAAFDLGRQVERQTGIAPLPGSDPMFRHELEAILEPLEPDDRTIARLLFVVVSETLISGSLTRIPRDRRVVDAVRETAADHAHDEGRHHAWFSTVLQAAWPQLSDTQRASLVPLVPEFILLFLRPDRPQIRAALLDGGIGPGEIDAVLDDSYTQARLLADARTTARATIALFTRVGALDIPEVSRAFVSSGLVPDAAWTNGKAATARHARPQTVGPGPR